MSSLRRVWIDSDGDLPDPEPGLVVHLRNNWVRFDGPSVPKLETVWWSAAWRLGTGYFWEEHRFVRTGHAAIGVGSAESIYAAEAR